MKKVLLIIAFLALYIAGQRYHLAKYEQQVVQSTKEKIRAYEQYDMQTTKSAEDRILDTNEREPQASDHLGL